MILTNLSALSMMVSGGPEFPVLFMMFIFALKFFSALSRISLMNDRQTDCVVYFLRPFLLSLETAL